MCPWAPSRRHRSADRALAKCSRGGKAPLLQRCPVATITCLDVGTRRGARMIIQRRRSAGALVVLLGAFAAASSLSPAAAGEPERAECRDNPVSNPDQSIAACTRVIEDAGEDAAARVEAYDNRGVAYHHKKDYDRALADFDAASKLDPKYAKAYCDRGITFSAKGD